MFLYWLIWRILSTSKLPGRWPVCFSFLYSAFQGIWIDVFDGCHKPDLHTCTIVICNNPTLQRIPVVSIEDGMATVEMLQKRSLAGLSGGQFSNNQWVCFKIIARQISVSKCFIGNCNSQPYLLGAQWHNCCILSLLNLITCVYTYFYLNTRYFNQMNGL